MYSKISLFSILFGILFSFTGARAQEQTVSFRDVQIILSPELRPPLKDTYLRVLKEEIQKRTSIRPGVSDHLSGRALNVILRLNTPEEVGGKTPDVIRDTSSPLLQPEGYRIFYDDHFRTLWITGADERGVMFGIGAFLRRSCMKKGRITLPVPLDITTAPAYPLRGHQLGYRNTANSYDAWDAGQYEQYIRDLVMFGTNAIENIPLGKDDSPHFKIPRKEMNVRISTLCRDYGIEYWVWLPVHADLKDPRQFTATLDQLEDYCKGTPYLSDLFIPGGDPGDNAPQYLMPFLKELHARVVKYHPNAGLWVSLQGFSEDATDYFYQYLHDHHPAWLTGVVSGPGSPGDAETHYRLPAGYRHRLYPDITHNIRCQYPAPRFDQALALTLGREGINPMPVFYAKVFRDHVPFSDGFITYSDGCHDDVNKVVWSMLGWDPQKPLEEILKDYSRYFFGHGLEEKVAAGILALEKNWYGPLKENGSVETTLAYWQGLDKEHPELSSHWRWQMLQLRAVYDAYVRRRLLVEKSLEREANNILARVDELGTEKAMDKALTKIRETETHPVAPQLRKEISDRCQVLFGLIGLQTSVKKYGASGEERGAILDFVDHPLNNRWWYEDQFGMIRKMPTEEAKKARLKIIREWETPGPGSYYDDVSNIANSPHVRSTVEDATDFAWWDNGMSRRRLSTQVFQYEPVLEYRHLDPDGRYLIRVSGYGDALIRVDGERLEPVVYNKAYETFKEFVVPGRLVGDMEIRVTFDKPEESRLNWRQYSKVSDVWLIKR